MPTCRLLSTAKYVKRTWDHECVVYVTAARETHLLTTPCAHILGMLEYGQASHAALHRELASLMADTEDHEVTRLLDQIIEILGKIGLIETHEEVL